MRTKFVILILPQVHILDLAGPDQAIHEAIDFEADFTITYCSILNEVKTTNGLVISNLQHYSSVNLDYGDYLLIPGSDYQYLSSNEFLKNNELFDWIRLQHSKGVNLCSICMGAFVLAETGLLTGKFCTTHFKKTKELQIKHPYIKVLENVLFTEEDTIFTSAGIATGIDLMLHIIEKLMGSYFSHLVARELVVYARRNGNSEQISDFMKFRNHIHTGVHKVQDFIIENIQSPLKLSILAEHANTSERNFTRIFKKEIGITVNQFITTIRITLAKKLLKNPNLSKTEIAQKVGLKSEKQLLRILSNK